MLWAPGAGGSPQFLAARQALSALHPRYIRLVIDWATFQPSAASALNLALPLDGCARTVSPCGAFAGVAGELEAIASEQRAARAEGRPEPEVVLDFFGVPAWASTAPHGCEGAASEAGARAISTVGIGAYRALIAELIALAASEDVQLPWWSPWNEPNDPRFLSPQRASCAREGQPLAPAVYAQLASAMAAQLDTAPGPHRILLGELGGYLSGSAHRLSVAEFVAALPSSVLCLGSTWTVHAYAARGRLASPGDPVAALESALAARGGCAASASIWVTEVGAGAQEPGRPRSGGRQEEAADCLALAQEVLGWYPNPRVRAVFQYTFRDDPDFPVGLENAALSHLYPVYEMWLALARAASSGTRPPSPQTACAGPGA